MSMYFKLAVGPIMTGNRAGHDWPHTSGYCRLQNAGGQHRQEGAGCQAGQEEGGHDPRWVLQQ